MARAAGHTSLDLATDAAQGTIPTTSEERLNMATVDPGLMDRVLDRMGLSEEIADRLLPDSTEGLALG